MPTLNWLTREADLQKSRRAPYRLLEPVPEMGYGDPAAGNLLIQGDNLDALKALLPYYAGRVKCIYIDPPYNTKSAFEHYDDNLEHSQWLSMIYPRLELLRELLSEDGSIWVSIDDNEGHYLKVVMDEIFGRKNFIATNVWQKRYSRENREAIGDVHEYVVVYARDPEKFKQVRNRVSLDEKSLKVYKNTNNDPLGPWRPIPMNAQGWRPNQMYPIATPTGAVHYPPEGLERIEDGPDRGKIKFSFANLLHRHRPLVIMDEAHNARTALTFEVLQRISPACIVEFTATPDTRPGSGSNVLFRVSAAELKAEEMIKLPILLTEHANWQEAVHDAVRTRARLAELADGERPDFLRPIVLFQAESKDREVTVDVLRQHLIENEKIPADRIAVATGSQRELDGIDLFDPACRVEHIITVEALKEGWDCSFAYVFCSAANIHSSKDVEQILGRVLRMPYARKRRQDELNRAYAHVSSPAFAEAAEQLKDRLVAMGFEEEEANAYVQPGQLHLPGEDDTPLLVYKPEEPLRLLVREAVDLSVFSPEEREKVRQVEKEPGIYELEVIGAIPETLQEKIVRIVPEDRKIEITRALQRHRYAQQRAPSPAERGEKFEVPRLCLWVQGELEPAEKELFLDAGGWNLLDFPATLTEAEFAVNESARTFEVDVQGKRVVYGLVNGSHQLDLGHLRTEWTDLELARWLDREVRQTDVRQEVLLEFLRRTVAHLTETRKIGLDTLVRGKFVLAKTLREKIAACRQLAYEHGYQETLFGPRAAVETSYRFAFDFPKDNYPARGPYKGAYKFVKHYYSFVGELESTGEEFECARAIDGLPEVKHWVRNLAIQPAFSFWLPTSTDRFYPDFVAELGDGRILVVEYKGEHIVDAADAREKRNLGTLWEEKSGGKGLFLMAEKRDGAGRDLFRQLVDKIRRES